MPLINKKPTLRITLWSITLKKYIENHSEANVEQCVFGGKLSLALVAIHSAGLLYRDNAPDNIMLWKYGKIELLDF